MAFLKKFIFLTLGVAFSAALAVFFLYQKGLGHFTAETWKTNFISHVTQLSGSQRLQFATLHQVEQFERTSEATLFWGRLKLPDLVVRVSVPVEYSYYLDLEGNWNFIERGQVLWVVAPRPSFNMPGVEISEMKFEVQKGSIFRREEPLLQSIKAELTEHLRQRAQSNISLVRETGRAQIEQFIAKWLVQVKQGTKIETVRVRFEDEPNDFAIKQ